MLKRTLIKIFQLIFAVSMLLIFGIALSKPLNNLIPERMVFFTLFWVLLYGGIWWGACIVEKKLPGLQSRMKVIVPILLVVYGVALYVVSCFLRSNLLTDYENVYEAAKNLATGQEVTNWDYFSRWYNNVGCMLMLAMLFFLGSWLPASVDLYYFVLLVNVVHAMLVIACLYYLVGKLNTKHSFASQLMLLMVGVLWIPIWANTSIFYTDQLSFGVGVFAVTLLVKGWNHRRWYLFMGAAGGLLAVGMILKVTVGTIAIAMLIIGGLLSLLWKNKEKIAVAVVIFGLVFGAFSLYCETMPYQEASYRLKIPVEYWFAIGLGENGTYSGSEEFAIRCLTAENIDVRREIARKYIVDNISNLWDAEHLIGKVRQNFGCGDMGAAGYYLYRDEKNFFWNCFSQEGKYFWKYACVSTAFFFSLLFIMGIGGVVQFVQKKELTRKDFLLLSAELAFWGQCLFLMLWEAQDKQLYNHSGWMMLSLIGALNSVTEFAERKLFRKNQKGL